MADQPVPDLPDITLDATIKIVGVKADTTMALVTDAYTLLDPAAVVTAQASADSAQAKADLALPKSGGTMTGPIILPGSPSTEFQAATKGYVDTLVTGGVIPEEPTAPSGNRMQLQHT